MSVLRLDLSFLVLLVPTTLLDGTPSVVARSPRGRTLWTLLSRAAEVAEAWAKSG